MKRSGLSAVGFIAVGLLTVCCNFKQDSENKTSEKTVQSASQKTGSETPDSVDVPILKIGHVGHDHQAALYLAAQRGEAYRQKYGLWLKPVKEKRLYALLEHGKKVAEIELYQAGGGSKMPTMMSQGHFEMGFGGVAAVAFFVDKGSPMKIISPLHTKGNMLVLKPEIQLDSFDKFVKWVKAQPDQVRIGFKNPVAVAKLVFERGLEETGVSYTEDKADTKADILLIHMKGEKNLVPGLQNEIIDGYVSNNPWCAIAEAKKVGRIVCELDGLPPGIWRDHPCCCIAATNDLIADPRKAEVAVKMLELILIATEEINQQPETAYADAAKWIGTSVEIERVSMQTSGYGAEPTKQWQEGIATWTQAMTAAGKLNGKLKQSEAAQIDELLFDFSLLQRAQAALAQRKAQHRSN